MSLTLALQLCCGTQAAAVIDGKLGNTAPPVIKAHHQSIVGPLDGSAIEGYRQGGEDMSTAIAIAGIPFEDTGTTCGYELDYPEACPSQPSGPDVVYVFTAPADMDITVDLCGSSYDTMVFVFDEWGQLVACNDDFYNESHPCGLWNSKIESAFLVQGAIYYIVVGGYVACGDYRITVTEYEPCVLECAGVPEGEPTLHDGYVDDYNGGCNSYIPIFQSLEGDGSGELVFCGKSGWFYGPGGDQHRDTDWFIATIGPTGLVQWTLDAEQHSYGFLLAPHDCDSVAITDQLIVGPCMYGSLLIQGQPGDMIWLWVGPPNMSPPGGFEGHEYDYVFTLSGLEGTVSVEHRSLSSIKGLFR